MSEDAIRSAVRDLTSEDMDVCGQAFRQVKEWGSTVLPVLFDEARGWDEKWQHYWLGMYGSGSPTDFLLHVVVDQDAVESLIEAMKDPNPKSRGFAASGLELIDDSRVPDLLADAVKDEDESVRKVAVWGLVKIGDQRSFELIMGATKDTSEKVRETAARALRRIGGPDAVDTLIAMLNDTADSVVRSAAYSLGRMHMDCAVDPLIPVMSSGNVRVQWAAVDALEKLGGKSAAYQLWHMLPTTQDSFLRKSIVGAIAKLQTPDTLRYALDLLRHSEIELQEAALSILAGLKELEALDVLPYVSPMLRHPDRKMRTATLKVLEKFKDADSADVVAQLLDDEDIGVRYTALLILASMKDERAVEPLLDLARNLGADDESCIVKDEHTRHSCLQRVVEALGQLGDSRAISLLVGMLGESESEPVRTSKGVVLASLGGPAESSLACTAAKALVRLGDDRGFQYLLETAERSTNLQARYDAVNALGHLKDPRGVGTIIRAFDKMPTSLRWSVVMALGSNGTQGAADALKKIMDAHCEESAWAASELAKLGYDSGLEFLRAEIESGDAGRRKKALMHVGFVRGPRVLDTIESLLDGLSAEEKTKVVKLLKEIHDERAVGLLKKMRNDSHRKVWVAAWMALRSLGEDCDSRQAVD